MTDPTPAAVERALKRQAGSVLAREVLRLRSLAGTWELAALAAMSPGLDAKTAGRVGDRMRQIVFGGQP